jgi:hypothetical protein
MMYKFARPLKINGESGAVFKKGEECDIFIPFDPANTDYQAYLKWVAEGNEPLPADTEE